MGTGNANNRRQTWRTRSIQLPAQTAMWGLLVGSAHPVPGSAAPVYSLEANSTHAPEFENDFLFPDSPRQALLGSGPQTNSLLSIDQSHALFTKKVKGMFWLFY